MNEEKGDKGRVERKRIIGLIREEIDLLEDHYMNDSTRFTRWRLCKIIAKILIEK